ncbi:electron transfer flavoprotein subunit beta/FixA family protein [Caproiciproducens sp. NJN-50]|uniref:electron transfer flavoprotein subunit beta/FixA family protein n=1 Tax=Acutalibacteraceae TaxID=3082771 RepID=UPI000FFE2C9D|nr:MULTISPECIES: electron transfer flavoprotein subunit beta/FixA family protein [Acutalibacteraceae]QAT49441.1 electron transfer flavoprotein subunit beta/FixA family protein [Caproiciproducens sp. NJN-50]
MNIVVCIKQVPNTDEIRLDPKTGTLIREGVPSVINPDDKAGLEAALRLKDSMGAHVSVLTLGPPQAEDVLREALAMGADEAVLVTDRAFSGGDTLATAYVIAAALKTMEYDLIVTGRQAIDGDTAQVGPQIAEQLNIPNISYAEDIRVEDSSVIVNSQLGDRCYVVKAKIPCLITVLSELNKPRYMTPGGIFDAYRKGIKKITRRNLDVDDRYLGLKGSPTRVVKTFTKTVKTAGTVIDPSDPQEAARCMLEKLREKFIL